MCVCGYYLHAMVCLWRWENNFWKLILNFCMWILRAEVRPSALTEVVFILWVFLLVVPCYLLCLLLSCNLNSTLSVSRMATCYGCLLNCIWNELNQKLLGTSGRDFLDQILWGRLFGTFWWQPRLKNTKGENISCLLTVTLAVNSAVFLLQHCFTNIRKKLLDYSIYWRPASLQESSAFSTG